MKAQNTSSVPPLELMDFGESEFRPQMTAVFHFETGYMLCFVQTGSGVLTRNGKDYPVRQGQAFLVFPGEDSKYRTDGSSASSTCWLRARGVMAEETLMNAGFSRERPTAVCTEIGSILRLMRVLLQTEKSRAKSPHLKKEDQERTKELMQTGYLYLILGKLTESRRKPAAEEDTGRNADKVYINAARNLLADPMLKISETAEIIGISRGYLSSIFKKETGLSPKEYQLQARMEKAGHLLGTSEASVSDIAEQLGYADVFSFSKSFHKYFGMSPSEYRARVHFDMPI